MRSFRARGERVLVPVLAITTAIAILMSGADTAAAVPPSDPVPFSLSAETPPQSCTPSSWCSTSATFTWAPPGAGTPNAYTVAGYWFPTTTVAYPATSVRVNGIAPGRDYALTLTATNADGSGYGHVTFTSIPADPFGVGLSARTATSATISWSVEDGGANAAATYTLTGNHGFPTTTVSGLSASVAGLRPDTSYSVTVTANDSAGRDPHPPTLTFTTARTGNEPASLWDTPIPSSWPVDPDSAQEVANYVSTIATHYARVGLNQMPVYIATPTTPVVPIAVRPGCNDFQASTGSGAPLPAGAGPNPPSDDDPVIISQPSTNSVWEYWQLSNDGPNGAWQACWGGKLDSATTDGVFPSPFGLSATGISYYGTMITEDDVQSGVIAHTLALQVTNCNYGTYPADRHDCGSDPGYFPEGAWVRIPASVPMPAGLTPLGQMVFRALQTYGAVVIDQAGANMVQAETVADWAFEGHSGTDPITAACDGASLITALNGIPWGSLQRIDPVQP